MVKTAAQAVWSPISEWLNRTTKVKYVLPAYLILAVGAWLGYTRLGELNAAQIAAQTQAAAVVDYNACANRVETRSSIRAILLAITAQFPESEAADQIVVLINEEYPPLDLAAECAPLLRAGQDPVIEG